MAADAEIRKYGESAMEITTLEKWIAKKINVDKLTQTNLKAYQLDKIREVMEYASKNSPFYRDLYLNLDIPSINLQNFSKVPFTSATDIQNQGTKMVCVEQDEIFRIVTLHTSGTTDKPKRIFFTKEDQELTVDFFDNGMQILTQPKDNVLILLPAQTPGCVGDLLAKGLERFGAIPHRYGIPQDFNETLEYIFENHIKVIVANPEHMLAIANLAEHTGKKPKIASILLSTDFLADSLMKQLTKTFGAKIYEHYGMTETGLGGGVSCQSLQGYHMRDADLYFEIIDPQTGENVADGIWGEIVFTTLTRKAMPLIRYRTGDYGRFLPQTCPCGSILKRLDKVYHRLDQQQFKITDFDEIIFSIDNIFNYEITINKNQKKITIILNTLNDNYDFTEILKPKLLPLTDGYELEIKKQLGFLPKHYQLQKRKINYV
jgi:phenylacetate-CoA ligase